MKLDKQLKLAFKLSPVPLLLVGPQGLISHANSAFETVFGYAAGELLGMPVEHLLPASVRDRHTELRRAYAEQPEKRQMGNGRDLAGVTRAGKLLPLELGLSPVEIDGDSYTIVTAIDISERKRAETLAQQTLEASASAMIMVEQTGTIRSVNRAACLMFGYRNGEMVGQSIEMLVPETFAAQHKIDRGGFFETGGPREMGRGQPLRGRHRSGNEFRLEVALTPLQVNGERLVLATVVDISERLAAERAIAEKAAAEAHAQRLQELNEELSRFAYATSHGLKSPFATLEGLLAVAMMDLDQGNHDNLRAILLKLKTLSRRSAGKIAGALRIAKVGLGNETFQQVEVLELVRAIWGDLTMHDPDAVRLDMQMLDLPPVYTNEDALSVILENLLGNAVRYADASKQESWVRFSATVNDLGVTFSVADNGIGFAEERRNDVFGSFVRLSEGSGDGLGLALVKRHVEALGGTISCDAQVGRGATFTVFLPRPMTEEESAYEVCDR